MPKENVESLIQKIIGNFKTMLDQAQGLSKHNAVWLHRSHAQEVGFSY